MTNGRCFGNHCYHRVVTHALVPLKANTKMMQMTVIANEAKDTL